MKPLHPSFTNADRFPFLFGAQYYRAPTPEADCWETDFQHMQALGFNAVKLWVQWRWSHRTPGRFVFDDLDRLMDLAAAHRLGVTLNVIFDVAPHWLYQRYPDARQVDIQGRHVQPYVVSHRQIGGHPGPCYNHPGALEDRQRFLRATLEHFRGHPALQLWDLWNEPEMSFPSRTPSMENLVCYCDHCRKGFLGWLQNKYGTFDRLNTVWGRCYEDWSQAELPRGVGGVIDFIDWREFHLDTMSAEARWRLELTASLDPAHGRYLHVVPNTWFSAVTCADDFAMAEPCECFGGTMAGSKPSSTAQVLSAGNGRVCYNAECHINFGSTALHQPEVTFERLLAEFLPQIGKGIKGFLFWQFRPEVLGLESPAWGLVNLDGSERSATRAARDFWAKLQPVLPQLRAAAPAPAQAAVWRSRRNEIFHFCQRDEVESFNRALDAWQEALYAKNIPYRVISSEHLEQSQLEQSQLEQSQLDGVRLLILPMPYLLSQAEADALQQWVAAGGTLITEAHLAGYHADTGRHSRVLPGGGLAQAWGLREVFSTAARHISAAAESQQALEALPPDVRKALAASGTQGSDFFAFTLANGRGALGAQRYAELEGNGMIPEGGIDQRKPCIASIAVGSGMVLYAGTHLSEAAARDDSGLQTLLEQGIRHSGVTAECEAPDAPPAFHVDVLWSEGQPAFAAVINPGDAPVRLRLPQPGTWQGVFGGNTFPTDESGLLIIPAGWMELLQSPR
ncbi:MAG: beta-galactosidase [Anaerolineae bacterium]|nr:beta-galactosidase [Anaerolineae bacterium]